jgi:hypothetical protein
MCAETMIEESAARGDVGKIARLAWKRVSE